MKNILLTATLSITIVTILIVSSTQPVVGLAGAGVYLVKLRANREYGRRT